MTKKDTSEYSSTRAPETREHADEKAGNREDPRLFPGGAHGSPAPQGMDALDRDTVPGGAAATFDTRYEGNNPREPNHDQ